MTQPTKDKSLIGAAGVHVVAAELSLRGLIALPTIRNTAGVDIIAVNKSGAWRANIQVKSSGRKATFWPVGKRYESWCGADDYYAFVRFIRKEWRFEVFLETATRVASEVSRRADADRKRGLKEWAPCWYLPEDVDRVARQWREFGPTVDG
jgi:hypothetical protein